MKALSAFQPTVKTGSRRIFENDISIIIYAPPVLCFLLGLKRNRFDLPFVDAAEEEERAGQRENFSERISQPNSRYTEEFGKDPSRRQNDDELSEKRHEQTVCTEAERLKQRGKYDAEGGRYKAQAEKAHSGFSHLQHFVGSAEDRHDLTWEYLEYYESYGHDYDRRQKRKL